MGKHPIVHIELAAKDPSQSAAFYRELFGWQSQHAPELNYTMFQPEGGPGGGFLTIGEHGTRQGEIRVYVGTDDVDATLKRAEALGATTLMGRSEIPGVGWFGVLSDPAGVPIGLFAPLDAGAAPPATPPGKHAIINVKISARDQAESARFYHELFGWRITPMPEIDYTMFDPEGGPTGGFITLGEHEVLRSPFCLDVRTDDVAATLGRAEALGGTTVHPKTELPGYGWMGGLADPAGTQIWLFTPNPAN